MLITLIFLILFLLVLTLIGIFLLRRRLATLEQSAWLSSLDERLKQLQNGQQQTGLTLSEHIMRSFEILRGQLTETLNQNAQLIDKQVTALTQRTDQRLQEISGQVEKRLHEGFERTTATFQDVLKRLALIDEAQKKMTELSGNVLNLQTLLHDKRSRGALGEVQLSILVKNILSPDSFSMQCTLSNQTRVDCLLHLPAPTGNLAIDAKFPLESFQRMTDIALPEAERQAASRQFKTDIKKHVQDIAAKYICPPETGEGAFMFLPAEAIFAEIHAHHPDLVQEAQRAGVWIVSPTTLMAVLTTARAVIKDEATRRHVHQMQQHLIALAKDFTRFQDRMDKLGKHITQAGKDVEDISKSSTKISQRFQRIEQVELTEPLTLTESKE